MKKLLLISLLVLFGCSSEDDEASIAKEVEFNCNPTNFIELYDGLTLKEQVNLAMIFIFHSAVMIIK